MWTRYKQQPTGRDTWISPRHEKLNTISLDIKHNILIRITLPFRNSRRRKRQRIDMQNLLNIQIHTSAGSYTAYTEKQSSVFTKLPGFYLVNARSLLPKVDAPRYPSQTGK